MSITNGNIPFSWSLSRHKCFSECQLKYAYSYYISQNGWNKRSPSIAQKSYRLKRLQSLPMVFGSSVHEVINRAIEENSSDFIVDANEMGERIRGDLNKAYQDSKYRLDAWMEAPNQYTMLQEFYYDGDLPQDKIIDYKNRIEPTVKHIIGSQTYRDLSNQGKVELVTAERFRAMEVDGINVWIVIDLCYRDLKTGKITIVDFKTSSSKANDYYQYYQMCLYAWFIQQAYELDSLEDIELRLEFLNDGISKSFTPKEIDLDNVYHLFRTSVESMYTLLDDVEDNKPKEQGAFQKTGNARSCENCNFREICQTG